MAARNARLIAGGIVEDLAMVPNEITTTPLFALLTIASYSWQNEDFRRQKPTFNFAYRSERLRLFEADARNVNHLSSRIN